MGEVHRERSSEGEESASRRKKEQGIWEVVDREKEVRQKRVDREA